MLLGCRRSRLLSKIRVKDLAAFNRFHSEKLLPYRGKTGEDIFVLNEVKTDGMLAF